MRFKDQKRQHPISGLMLLIRAEKLIVSEPAPLANIATSGPQGVPHVPVNRTSTNRDVNRPMMSGNQI